MAKKGVAELLLQVKTAGEEALGKVSDALEQVGKVGAVAFGYLSALVVKSVADFRVQEEATNALSRALINNGIYSKSLKDSYLEQASALQKVTTFGDESIIAAQAALQQQIGQTKITKELTSAILDFATAQKVDLVTAANLVGKSIGTNTNGLARYGIEVSSTASSSEKLSQVMTGLNQKFGGQAEAAAQGLGSITQLQNMVSDLFETIGERLAPAIEVFIGYLKNLVPSTDDASQSLDVLVSVFKTVASAAVAVIEIFRGVGEAIGTAIGSGVAVIEAVLTGNFSRIKDIVSTEMEEYKRIATDKYQKIADTMAAIDGAESNRKQTQIQTDAANEAATREMAFQNKLAEKEAQRVREGEAQLAADDLALQLLGASEEQKLQTLISYEEKRLQTMTTNREKAAQLEKLHHMKVELANAQHREKEKERQKKADEEMTKNRQSTLSTIATMQSSNNSVMAGIGKAAALTQIAIETPVAISRALSAFPPPINFAAAGAVAAAMAAQAAKVSGIALAEGGIVMPRPGGTQAIIGEAGQAEAVIPLDRAGEFGLGGGGVTIVVNGGLLGNEQQAREFALAVDKELLNLRRNNESQAFDRGVV